MPRVQLQWPLDGVVAALRAAWVVTIALLLAIICMRLNDMHLPALRDRRIGSWQLHMSFMRPP
jgi:hypothetical protein